jgi:nucleoside-specific outer membrane channel protein Tsx
VAKSLHFNPQIKYDVGKALGQRQKQFYAGIEWDYWSNKYGIEDTSGFETDQNALSLLLKVHF